jgi:sulfate adenylyltransferase subunit 1
MDLLDFRQEIFEQIRTDFEKFTTRVFEGRDVRFIPISALNGDNVVEPSVNTSWYSGDTLLTTLETIPVKNDNNLVNPRFPVQCIIRPESQEYHDYRGYAGRIASGIFRKGDRVVVLPCRLESTIQSIDTFSGEMEEAFAPESVSITLKDDIDISRGDMIVKPDDMPTETRDVEAIVCWMSPRPLQVNGKYAIKHTTRDAKSVVKEVSYILNINTLEQEPVNKTVNMNDIALVKLRTTQSLFVDAYSKNRITGSLILIDEATNETVGAGMII